MLRKNEFEKGVRVNRESEQRNVMLPSEGTGPENEFEGKQFPCPVCGAALDIRMSRRDKPYCVCNWCGIQLFFRDKVGIRKLKEIVDQKLLISGETSQANLAVTLFNRLEQLQRQRDELKSKRGILYEIFPDKELETAISALGMEIERVREALAKVNKKLEKRK